MTRIAGKVWKFGDNVNTDAMAPGFAAKAPWDELRKVILHIHPKFIREVKPGDVIVAGANWGCGSSRETAPANLKRLGLGFVLAESFGRIYFRNSIALAFPSLICAGVSEACEEGDRLELELETGRTRNLTTGRELQAERLSHDILEIIAAGGLMSVLRQRVRAQTG